MYGEGYTILMLMWLQGNNWHTVGNVALAMGTTVATIYKTYENFGIENNLNFYLTIFIIRFTPSSVIFNH